MRLLQNLLQHLFILEVEDGYVEEESDLFVVDDLVSWRSICCTTWQHPTTSVRKLEPKLIASIEDWSCPPTPVSAVPATTLLARHQSPHGFFLFSRQARPVSRDVTRALDL